MELDEEAELIRRALLLHWNCHVCQRLKWNLTECKGEKENCGANVYRNLKQHFFRKIKQEFQIT